MAREDIDAERRTSGSSGRNSDFHSPRENSREIEMVGMSRVGEYPGFLPVYRAQVLGQVSPVNSIDDSFHDADMEVAPSPSAVAAVRVCIWACFLFFFLMVMHGQQDKSSSDSRGSSRLRSVQLVHFEVPWTQLSAFSEKSAFFTASVVDRNTSLFQVVRFDDFSSRRENQGLLMIQSAGNHPDSTVFVQRVDDGFIFITTPSIGKYEYEYHNQSRELHLGHPLVFFHLFEHNGVAVAISRPSKTDSSLPYDCVSFFNSSSSSCYNSVPILRGTSYFYDHPSNRLVSVGTDELTVDMNGYDASGVFVQSIKASDGSLDFSITIPFLNRYDEGVWAIQNSPMTDGYIVLVAKMGFPPSPVQHVVLLTETGEFSKGTVLKLGDADLNLFRKADSLQFNMPLSGAKCSC